PFRESPLCSWYPPLPPWGEPLTPLSPPSSHLKDVVIPSPIVFYLTQMYKSLHILLSGRPCSEHQAERGSPRENKLQKPDFNSPVPSSTLACSFRFYQVVVGLTV